ncbi:MAG: Rieske (2Fe-2S) protein [Verrucomicrobiota bacterium]
MEVAALQTGPGCLYLSLASFPALQSAGGSVQVNLSAVDTALIVTRASVSVFHALDSVCTHAGCTVGAFVQQQGHMQCPCHGSRYDIQGRVVRGPAEENLASFVIEFDGADELKITLPSLPLDVKPIRLYRRVGNRLRFKLTFPGRSGRRYQLRFQTDVTSVFVAVPFAVSPNGQVDQWETTASSDGPRHLYVETDSQRGFYTMSEMK